MKYKILLFIFLCCGFKAFSSLADDYIQEVKAKRAQNKVSFESYVRDIQYCLRFADNLSKNFTEMEKAYKTKMVQVQRLCGAQVISQREEFLDCIGAQLNLNQDLKNATNLLSDSQGRCSRLDDREAVKKLNNLVKKQEDNISDLKEKYKEFLMNQLLLRQAEIGKEYIEKGTSFRCNMNILSDFKQLVFRDMSAMFSSEFGDSYGFEKGLKVMNMLKDKISTTVKICKPGDLSDKVIESEQMIQKVKNQFGKPFDEFAQKICSLLDKTPKNNALCETPLNNNSWKYSVSQALQKQLGYKVR